MSDRKRFSQIAIVQQYVTALNAFYYFDNAFANFRFLPIFFLIECKMDFTTMTILPSGPSRQLSSGRRLRSLLRKRCGWWRHG